MVFTHVDVKYNLRNNVQLKINILLLLLILPFLLFLLFLLLLLLFFLFTALALQLLVTVPGFCFRLALFLLALFYESPAVLVFNGPSLVLLLYLSFLSAAAFSLWYLLIQYNRLSSMAVYRFLIPVCAALLSVALIDGEQLHWPALLALVLVCFGMVLTARE